MSGRELGAPKDRDLEISTERKERNPLEKKKSEGKKEENHALGLVEEKIYRKERERRVRSSETPGERTGHRQKVSGLMGTQPDWTGS